ncbi:winged helix DNA-binding domain-containing protein [Gordonia liuliyuniae]|uniref:Winged helix DNA-binding domain-containing protein n=1 Tax=Gordonia liuliyuniae TaxID=2911517 RepID=A0ABS9INZ3_9ACTN|nr:winged helix DNA-binding domain-containing protein [Gordonia liuliyuniae]MCF8587267.1 winged helix DNA-binding domain-containing protein [Gordonia liuliyuniae]
MARALTLEQWNRTLLARQHLLERVDDDVMEVVDRLVGLQSQDPQAAFYGLACRVQDFDPADVDDLLIGRELVRMTLQRGTVFLMDGLDARWVRALVQPSIDAAAATNHGKKLRAATAAEIVDCAVELLTATDEPVRGSTLRDALVQRWPDEPATDLAAVARWRLPLVQTPPRGLWRASGAPAYRLLDDWIGPGEPAVTGDEARRDLVRLYLRGFGPATVNAVQTWSGLTGLGPLIAAMEADWELVELTGPGGEKLYDLEGLPIASGDERAPVRCVAPYDNLLVANADRVRVADPGLYTALATPNGRFPGFVLVDGWLAATWAPTKDGVTLTELRDLTSAERSDVEREVSAVREMRAAATRRSEDCERR